MVDSVPCSSHTYPYCRKETCSERDKVLCILKHVNHQSGWHECTLPSHTEKLILALAGVSWPSLRSVIAPPLVERIKGECCYISLRSYSTSVFYFFRVLQVNSIKNFRIKMAESSSSAFSNALADFCMNLYRQIGSQNAESNVFFSPMSISFALSMTYAGSAGDTKSQLKKMLFGDWNVKSDDELHAMYSGTMGQLNKDGAPYKLHLANRVYAHHSTLGELVMEFVNILKQKYNSELEALDFGKGDEAATVINSWVSEKTNEKIKDIIPAGVLNDMTKMVLVNAIYFKGDWQIKFDPTKTKPQTFYAGPNKEIQEEMMNLNKQKFYYNQGDGYQLLGMPYKGKDMIMYIWLPKERNGLAGLENKLNGKTMLESINTAHADIELERVAIPKFKLEETIQLEKVLQALGATDMFKMGTADLSKINGKRDLYISKVIHKAFVDVNEEGTEAAAATAVVMMMRAMPMPSPSFIADHPFVFAIVDKPSNSILFLGRYNGK